MERVCFSHNEGEGIIADSSELLPVVCTNVKIGTTELVPGIKTTMNGFFLRDVQFQGMLNKTEMVFLLGSTDTLFESKTYYKVVHFISETRIFIVYGAGFGRDYNFVKGRWK